MKLFKTQFKASTSHADEASAGLFARLGKSRERISGGLLGLFKQSKRLDQSLYEDIEDQLLMADMGVDVSQVLVEQLKKTAADKSFSKASQLTDALRQGIVECLSSIEQPPSFEYINRPHVILMIGVNGVGKTTTLAKLANRFKSQGKKVMLAACDTFRAAAIEQLQTWGRRLDIPVIAQNHGADAAAVAFDAYNSALARGIEVLLIDTAGRQHTHDNLMQQLGKISRVLGKTDNCIPDEVLLTIDAGNGQNVLSQVERFNAVIGVTGLCVSKLDGTARGGILVALADRFGLPVRYIGVGENLEDLQVFEAAKFAQALLP